MNLITMLISATVWEYRTRGFQGCDISPLVDSEAYGMQFFKDCAIVAEIFEAIGRMEGCNSFDTFKSIKGAAYWHFHCAHTCSDRFFCHYSP